MLVKPTARPVARRIQVVLIGALGLGLLPAICQADTWTGRYTGRSGILWTYTVQTAGQHVKLRILGDKEGKKFDASCADSSLDGSDVFETSCAYGGSNLRFKVRAQLRMEFTYATYVAENGDRTAVELTRESKIVTPYPPASARNAPQANRAGPTLPNTPSAAAPPAATSSDMADLRLPACDRMSYLMNFTRHSFVNGDDPILGIPPGRWTVETLNAVERWATRCLSGDNRSAGTWETFRRDAIIGMDMRREQDRKAEAARKAQEALDERWTRTTALSAGGSVSCRQLGSAHFSRLELDSRVFGQALRAYTPADFEAVFAVLADCQKVDWDPKRRGYFSDLGSLDSLPRQREALLAAEAAAQEQARLAAERVRQEQEAEAALVERAKLVAAQVEQNPRAFGGTWPEISRATGTKLIDPPVCHDPQVLTFFLEQLYGKRMADAVRAFRERPSAATAQTVLALSQWKISVENIRQTNFDAPNHVRQCEATFQSNADKLEGTTEFPGWMRVPSLDCGSLTPRLSYRLELLLDKPTEFYVSYVCRQ